MYSSVENGKSVDKKIATIIFHKNLTAKEYHKVGNTLLTLAKELEPILNIRVELLALDEDGAAPFEVYP